MVESRASSEPTDQIPETGGDSLFPASERVVYGRSPLEQVVCQLRFPAILRIDAQPPAEFQEIIRSVFPIYQAISAPGPAPGLPPDLIQLFASAANTNFLFGKEDGTSTISLTKETLSLTTIKYERWEGFLPDFTLALLALSQVYKPAFFARIGLRYQNRIRRSALGLDGRRWRDLLRPEIVGELIDPSWEDNLLDARRVIRVNAPAGDGSMHLQHGHMLDGSSEPGYLIDFDFYTEGKAGVENVGPIIDRFHRRAGRAFRWCITETLHGAMEPRALENNSS